MNFAYVEVLSGCIPHLLQSSLIASGQSTVDELDRRLRPDRSILPLIDFARQQCVDKHKFCCLAVDRRTGRGCAVTSAATFWNRYREPVRHTRNYRFAYPRRTNTLARIPRAFRGSTLYGHEIILPPKGRTPTMFTRRQETDTTFTYFCFPFLSK